ncbi:TPA: MFS transporter, partial [Klebsiella pneumoniae]
MLKSNLLNFLKPQSTCPCAILTPIPVQCLNLLKPQTTRLTESLLIGGLSSFFAILLGTRILLGIGEGLYYPMQNTIIKNWFPAGERGRANTAWILGQSLAPALAMPLYTWIIAEHSWRHTFYFSFSLTLLPIVLIYFFTSNFPQENKYVNVLELQKINKSTTEEFLHKNSSEKISVVERAKVYLCNSNFWILLAIFSS